MPDSEFKRFEDRLEKHIQATNSKLDLLIEVSRHVAVLQTEHVHITESIRKLELNAVQDRIAAIKEEEKLEHELQITNAERRDSEAETRKQLMDAVTTINTKLDYITSTLHDKVDKVGESYRSDRSYIKGIIAALTVVFMGVQGVVIWYVNDSSTRNKELIESVKKVDIKQSDLNSQLEIHLRLHPNK